jgi:hypothetical protein
MAKITGLEEINEVYRRTSKAMPSICHNCPLGDWTIQFYKDKKGFFSVVTTPKTEIYLFEHDKKFVDAVRIKMRACKDGDVARTKILFKAVDF